MSVSVRKVNISGMLLFIVVIIQLCLIIVSCFEPQDRTNYAMYIINYIVGFLAILSLLFKGVASHILAIAFLGCYMLFLMAQKPFEPYYNVYLTFARVELNTNQYFAFSIILFAGIAVTYYSYIYFSNKSIAHGSENVAVSYINFQALKPLLTVMLAITLPCAVYMQGYIVLVRGSMAYTSGYLINVYVPTVIKIGYYLYSTVVLLYLALKPTKRQMIFVLTTYLVIEGGFQIFQGRRALFASTILFIVWYLFKYYEIKKVNFKLIFRIMLVLVTLLMILIIVEQSRDNATSRFTMQLVKHFLISTGGSDSVIANTIYRKESFPVGGIAYLLDPFINNPIGNALLGKTSSAQGMTYLQQHNSFSHWISYMTESSLYLSGHGMGSSYLAEIYLAFGMVGIVLISIILGWGINKINIMEFNGNIFRSAFIFFLVRRLFTFPRDGMFSWVGSLIYLVFTYVILYPFYRRYCKRR